MLKKKAGRSASKKEAKKEAKAIRDIAKYDAKLEGIRVLAAKLEEKRESAMRKRPAEFDQDFDTVRIKKVKYDENPFLVKKSSYNKRLFQVNHPFIQVVEAKSLEAMPLDKVSDDKMMNPEALTRAADLLLKPVVETRERFKNPHGELSNRVVHASCLHGIKWLTLPSGSLSKELAQDTVVEDSLVEDSLLVAGGTELVWSTEAEEARSLHESSDELLHEGDKIDWGDLVTLEKYDLKGQVRDLQVEGFDNFVTVLIVECDWEGSPKKLYQGSSYAATAACSNLSKGCTSPIYIENWAENSWRYGVLRPEAVVTVKDGKVVQVTGSAEVGQLQEHLDAHTKTLQEDYLSPNQVPDKDYVMGTLHVLTEQKFDLPNVFSGKYITADHIRFLHSLIRIFVGDARALNLTVEQIDKNVVMREAAVNKLMSDFRSTMQSALQEFKDVNSKVNERRGSVSQSRVRRSGGRGKS